MARKPRETLVQRALLAAEMLDGMPDETSDEMLDGMPGAVAAEATIDEIRRASPKQAASTIWRLDRDTGEKRWLAQVASELISEQWLAKKYGGGSYRVLHKKPNERNVMVFAGQDTYEIDPAVMPEGVSLAGPMSAPIMNADGSAAGSRMDSIIESGVMQMLTQMQNQNQLTMAFVQQMTAEKKPSAGLLEIVTAIGPFIPAVVDLLKSKKDSTELLLEVAQIFKPGAGTGSGSITDALALLKQGIELGSKISGNGGNDEVSTMAVVNEGMKTLGGIVNAIVENKRQQNAGRAPASYLSENQSRESGHYAPGSVSRLAHEPVALSDPRIAGHPASDHAARGIPGHENASGVEHGPGRLDGAQSENGSRENAEMPVNPSRPWQRKAAPFMGMLIGAARFTPPEAAAFTIERNMSDDELEDLITDIEDEAPPGFANRLVAAFPAVARVDSEWIGAVIEHVYNNATADDDGEKAGDEKAETKAGASSPVDGTPAPVAT